MKVKNIIIAIISIIIIVWIIIIGFTCYYIHESIAFNNELDKTFKNINDNPPFKKFRKICENDKRVSCMHLVYPDLDKDFSLYQSAWAVYDDNGKQIGTMLGCNKKGQDCKSSWLKEIKVKDKLLDLYCDGNGINCTFIKGLGFEHKIK